MRSLDARLTGGPHAHAVPLDVLPVVPRAVRVRGARLDPSADARRSTHRGHGAGASIPPIWTRQAGKLRARSEPSGVLVVRTPPEASNAHATFVYGRAETSAPGQWRRPYCFSCGHWRPR